MAGPWERYQQAPQQAAQGPWTRFAPTESADPTEQPSVIADVAKAGASGIARGAADLAGLPGTISNVLDGGMEWLLRKGYGAVTGEAPSPEGGAVERFFAGGQRPGNPMSGDVTRGLASAATGGATDYKAQTTPGEYAGTIGEFLPGAAAFGGLNPGNLARFGVLPGAASEGAGQLTEGTALEPYARVGAALLAPAIPALARRAVTPFPASPERLKATQTLAKEGVTVTAGQKTGSNALRYAESEIGGAKAADVMGRQGEQFTAAILKRAGINANRATPEVIDDAFSTIGKQFDDLALRNTMKADPQFVTDLRQTFSEYASMVPDNARAPIVKDMATDIVKTVQQQGGLSGEAYQAFTSRLGRAARAAKADPQLSQALSGIKETLDDAMERTIQAVNPQDAGAWSAARRNYRNLLVIEKAATGAGENAAQGIISPSQLRNATVQQGRRAYARGKGDFADLARAGEAVMKPLPNSGTAGRTAVRNLGMGSGGLLGAGIGTAATGGNPLGAMAGAALGTAVPAVAGRAMMSRPGQALLGNQLAGRGQILDHRYAAILSQIPAIFGGTSQLGRSQGQ